MQFKSIESHRIADALHAFADFMLCFSIGPHFDEELLNIRRAANIADLAKNHMQMNVALYSERTINAVNRCFRVIERGTTPGMFDEQSDEARRIVRFLWNRYININLYKEYTNADKEVDAYIVKFRKDVMRETDEKIQAKTLKKIERMPTQTPSIKRRFKR